MDSYPQRTTHMNISVYTYDYLFPISFQCVSVKPEYVCNVIQRVNSMVQWQIINDIIMYIDFEFFFNIRILC